MLPDDPRRWTKHYIKKKTDWAFSQKSDSEKETTQ